MTAPDQLALIPTPLPPPAPVRAWAKRGEYRAWARKDRQLHDAVLDAYEIGDEGLIEAARRTYRENLRRMPPCAARRNRR